MILNLYSDFQTKQIQKNLLSKKPIPTNENILIENVTSVTTTPIVEQWRRFLLTDFSKDFLVRLSFDLFGQTWQYIQGEYYLFISAIGGEKLIPYYKVSLFSRKRNATLKSYLSVITSRHFYQQKKKDAKLRNLSIRLEDSTRLEVNFSGNEVIENPWYALLISENSSELLSENDFRLTERLKEMIEKLPQKEQKTIQMSTYTEYSSEDIFEELLSNGLIKPKRDVSKLTSKDKQDAVANIRKRALNHLKILMEL